MIDSLIHSFGLVAKKKSTPSHYKPILIDENHLIFHDPNNLNIDPDREEILMLNEQLLLNPDGVIVPHKF
jgi:hypothetical protein